MIATKSGLVILLLTAFSTGDEITEVDIVTSTEPTKSVTEKDENLPPVTTSVLNDYPTNFQPSRPNFGFGNISPNILHNFFTQIFRPQPNTGKTYGPNVIAIIGDKPYISMEIFHKFTPFRWLLRAFQGKIQNICGHLASPNQDEFPLSSPQNTLPQFLGGETPLNGEKPNIPKPVRIYNVPVGYRRQI